MVKRVCRTRFIFGAILVTIVLVAGGVVAPVFARVDITVAQSGDPTDGLDADSGGSSTQLGGATRETNAKSPVPTRQVLLIPVSVAGVLMFRVVVLPIVLNPRS